MLLNQSYVLNCPHLPVPVRSFAQCCPGVNSCKISQRARVTRGRQCCVLRALGTDLWVMSADVNLWHRCYYLLDSDSHVAV